MTTNRENFMDQIFHTNDVAFAQFPVNDVVAGESHATAAALGETSLVDQVANTLQVGVSPCNVGFANAEHVQSSL